VSGFLTATGYTPLADGANHRVDKPYNYASDFLRAIVRVPPGFITDFASVPKLLRSALPVWNVYGPAAVIHDFLYWSQTTTREEADAVLLEAMRVLGVPEATAQLIYDGVRLGGQIAWDNNAELKASGYTRMASLQDLPPYASPVP